MKLFLLIGQSNMAGRGKVEPQDQVVNPKIFMLTKDLTWVPAKDPLHFDKPAAGVGLGSQFAREISKADPNASIGLIPCAVGGTSLDQWKAGGALYNEAVKRSKEAMKNGKLAGILWHQGEADSAPDKVATYADRFSVMIGQISGSHPQGACHRYGRHDPRNSQAMKEGGYAKIPVTTLVGFTPVSFWSRPWKGKVSFL
ncbi:MAG: sialate O-acetylesterase [Verrucomicrobiales bacterium]